MEHIQSYLNNITSQHRGAVRFIAWLTALLKAADGAFEVLRDMPDAFDPHSAVGAQLDVIGMLVGVGREFPPMSFPYDKPLLDDDVYRRVILAKIVKNSWRGNLESLSKLWDETMRGIYRVVYIDNQDMTVDATVTGDFTPAETELILQGRVVPKPMGVRIHIDLCTRAGAEAAGGVAGIGTVCYGKTKIVNS